jgi:hypothetical protein
MRSTAIFCDFCDFVKRLDGINSALKRTQIFQLRAAYAAFFLRRADDGNGFRRVPSFSV